MHNKTLKKQIRSDYHGTLVNQEHELLMRLYIVEGQ